MPRHSHYSHVKEIENTSTRRTKLMSYTMNIHNSIVEVDKAFYKRVNKTIEPLSVLDIVDIKIENSLKIKEKVEITEYLQYGETSTRTEVREKSSIDIVDIIQDTNIIDLQSQFNQLLDQLEGKSEAEIEAIKDDYYRSILSTSFAHDLYVDPLLDIFSKTIDFIPFVGTAKLVIESIVGITLTGDYLTTAEQEQMKTMAVISVFMDGLTILTFGAAGGFKSMAEIGIKGVGKESAKSALKGITVGWAGEGIEGTLNGMNVDPTIVSIMKFAGTAWLSGQLNKKIGKQSVKVDIERPENIDFSKMSDAELLQHLKDNNLSFSDLMDPKEALRHNEYWSSILDGTHLPPGVSAADYARMKIAGNRLNQIEKAKSIKGTGNTALDDVKNGKLTLDNTQYKGNFGEMNMDDVFENGDGLNRISDGRVLSLDQKIAKGIDGVYEDPFGGPPKFIIGEAKYNTSQLNKLANGTKQMSDTWVIERLEAAVGPDKAMEILFEMKFNPGNVQFVVLRTLNESGDSIKEILDNTGKVIERIKP